MDILFPQFHWQFIWLKNSEVYEVILKSSEMAKLAQLLDHKLHLISSL